MASAVTTTSTNAAVFTAPSTFTSQYKSSHDSYISDIPVSLMIPPLQASSVDTIASTTCSSKTFPLSSVGTKGRC